MNWSKRSLAKWRQCSRREKTLLLEALGWLALARLAILLLPFKVIAPYVGHPQQETPADIEPAREAQAGQVGWAVRAAAAHTPWESTCLVQAIAAQRMLHRRGIPGTLYLGVAKDPDNPARLKAHAWVRCAATILTGHAGYQQFTVVSSYGFHDNAQKP